MSDRYDIRLIQENAIRVLADRKVPTDQAKILVESMLEADKCGVSTHGIRMLPAYIRKIDNGEFSLDGIVIKKQTTAFTSVDARNNIGAYSAYKCMEIAVEKAKENGVHMVFAHNCSTLGPAFFYAEKMAEQKLVGFVCSNSPAAMPANNGLEAMLGTNPFAFACPSKQSGIIITDMATSIVAKSKFLEAKNKGVQLPEGWALDCDGNPTTDPVKAISGLVLPMAGVKGYGIAIAIDILAGALSGAAYLKNVGKFYSKDGKKMNVGHMFVAIDPSIVYDGDFFAEMDDYIATVRNSKTVEGKVITLPGDGRGEKRRIAIELGIELAEETVDSLNKLFDIDLQGICSVGYTI